MQLIQKKTLKLWTVIWLLLYLNSNVFQLHRDDAVLMMMIIKYLIESFESHNWNNVIALIKLWFEIQLE